jgi:hypothetical protein
MEIVMKVLIKVIRSMELGAYIILTIVFFEGGLFKMSNKGKDA